MQADSFPEDWGHRIIFDDPQLNHKVSVCCGHVGGNQWSCICDPYRSFSDKLFRRPLPLVEMRRVILAIEALLAKSPEFFDVEWFENDARLREFNHGPRALSEAED